MHIVTFIDSSWWWVSNPASARSSLVLSIPLWTISSAFIFSEDSSYLGLMDLAGKNIPLKASNMYISKYEPDFFSHLKIIEELNR